MADEQLPKEEKVSSESSEKETREPVDLTSVGAKGVLRRRREESMFSQMSHEDEHERGEADDLQTVVFSCPVDHEGTAVYVKGWLKPNTEKRSIVIVHGLGENIGLYRDAARMFHERGFSVYGFDLRGHGRSGRMLGHISHYDSLVNDLLQVVNWIRHKSEKRQPPFILGQGLGALIAVYFQRAYPRLCPGAVLLNPWIVPTNVSLARRFMIRALAEVSPTVRLPRSLTPKFLAPNPVGRKTTSGARPLGYAITANFAAELMAALDGAYEKFREFSCQSLIICPVKDNVYDYGKVFEMVGRHSRKNMFDMREWPGAEQNLLMQEDGQLQKTVSAIAAWLDALERQLEELKNLPRQAAVSKTDPDV